jgi:uncharacterized protein YutE (UPF0331/DUF86 family)
LADHLISEEEWGMPGSFSEAIDKLAEHGVLPQADAETYKSMVRFRNLTVHAYAKVDFRQVHDIMKTGPDNIERFIDAIVTYCKL